MIASLPMYFAPAEAVQSFWSAVASLMQRAVKADLPEQITWPQDYDAHWLLPDLLLSQTCGYPLTTRLKGKVQLVGSVAYDVPEAAGIWCKSVLICRAADVRQTLNDFAGSTLAYNGCDSQSGYNALRALVAQHLAQQGWQAGKGEAPAFFGAKVETGSHGKSILAVAGSQADMASVDCVTFRLWQLANPELAKEVRVFGVTESYPGLPLITSLDTPAPVLEALQQSLHTVATDPIYAAVRKPLLITGFEAGTLAQYQRCVEMEADALKLGVSAMSR